MSLNAAAERVRLAKEAWDAVGCIHEGPEATEYRGAVAALVEEACVDDGLTEEQREAYRIKAACMYGSDDIEVDGDALISVGDDSLWVQAWVLVAR